MKNFRLIFLFALCLSSISSFAKTKSASNYGLYLGGVGGIAADDGEGNAKLQGPVYGGIIGYRWVYWALEVGFSQSSLKAKPGPAIEENITYDIENAEVKATSIDYMLRFFILRYFTLGLGYTKVNASHDFVLTNIGNDPSKNLVFKEDLDYSGGILQAGLVLPLFSFLDLQLLYERREWINDDIEINSDSTIDPIGVSLQQFTGRLVFYF
jgi:hypothetical protein